MNKIHSINTINMWNKKPISEFAICWLICMWMCYGCVINCEITNDMENTQSCDLEFKDAMDKKKFDSLPPVDFSLANATKDDVIYKLFVNSTQPHGKILTEETVATENLTKNVPTILIIHGWTTDDTSPWFGPLKDAYFCTGAHNIFYINWSKAGNQSYSISSANTDHVGKFIAEFLIASGIPQHNIQIVGHSLGSQLSSFIGKHVFNLTGKKLGRITALDPAGPKWEQMNPDKRLCHEDAVFVDVHHTDIQYYGFTKPIGHVDFYPNGGGDQPGCPGKDVDDNCSHARSTKFFIESITTKVNAKEAIFCEKDKGVKIKVKDDGEEIIFGQHTDLTARGVYYIETSPEAPYLKEM